MKPDCLPKKRRQRLCMDRPIWLAALCVLRVLSHGRAANVTPARPRVRPSADWTSCYTRFAGIDGRALARAAIKRCSQNIIPDARLAVSRRHLHQDRFDLRARRDSISAPRPGTRPVHSAQRDPRSLSYWSSAAVCANAGRASINKNGNRPHGTPDQAGRSIQQLRTSPPRLVHRQNMFSGASPSMT